MAKSTPADPNRTRLLELLEQLQERTNALREYGMTPGNLWLAQGEVQNITQLVNEIDLLLEDIKASDAEDGY